MKLKTPRQRSLIVNNIVAACEDITKLNRTGYKWIYLQSGFIAHYNLHGFIAHYTDRGNLAYDIIMNKPNNQRSNFHPNCHYHGHEYEYHMQQRDIYNEICRKVKDFVPLPF